MDNGSSSGKELFDDIVLAGAKIGQSKLAQGRAQALFDQMKDENVTCFEYSRFPISFKDNETLRGDDGFKKF